MDLFEIFSYGFMVRALIGGLLIGLLCGVLGVFLVLRRISLIGDGLAHITFGSVAVAMVAGVGSTLLTAATIPLVLLSAFGIQRLVRSTRLHGDAAIGIISAAGIAGGVILASLAGGFSVDLLSFLFGSILAISREELLLAAGLCIVVIGSLLLFYQDLFAATFDEELARTSGINVDRLTTLLLLLTALTVVLAMKLVGIMLISALLILPASTALQCARSFRGSILLAAAVSALSVAVGILLSFTCNLPSGATIVMVNLILFLLALPLGAARSLKNRQA